MSYQDPIAEHSVVLCEQFNKDPNIILDLARSFGGQNKSLVSAQITEVSQSGFLLSTRDATGRRFQTKVTSSRSMHSITQVHDMFATLTTKSSQSTRKIQKVPGQPPGWRVYWPNWNLPLVALAAGVSCTFYVYFFPDTKIPVLQWALQKVGGMPTIRSWVHFAIGLHSFQTITAWYLMRRVAAYRFTIPQRLVWTGCVQFFGIGSMLKLLPIVYNSAYVHALNEQQQHEGEIEEHMEAKITLLDEHTEE
ncbi:hypothetical protein CPC16_001587 [Podila verticillata]|nr:hypothetical protein BGZ52_008260 [Haplosporangium bisporale]KAF9373910.1 hypothetical protein CPC16_001587 [Podila verticillata]